MTMTDQNSLNAMDYMNMANQGTNIVDSIFGEGGLFGHSSWYRTLKNAEAQAQVNKDMALWNFNNITLPVFDLEGNEYDRRTAEQMAYWEEQFNMQNAYNTPKAQLERMKEAGLNPALLQGETGAMQAAQGMGVNPTMNEAASQMAEAPDLARMQAANAQADLYRQQAIATSIDNITRPMLNWGKIKTQNVQLDLARSETKFTYAKTEEVKTIIKQMEENTKLIHQNLENAKESYKILQNEVRRTLAEAMTSEFNADTTKFNRDIMREAMQSQDPESGAGYYDPVNSFLAKWWRNNKFWTVQQYIDEHNLKPYQAMVLRSQAALNGSMTGMYNAEIPILKLEGGMKAMKYEIARDSFDLRKDNVLGTLKWQNGILRLKSENYPVEYWSDFGLRRLHQAMDALNTVADFNSWLPDRMLKKVGNVVGTFSGINKDNNVPGVPGSQSTGPDIWEMGNSGGYDLNYGW